MAFGGMRHLRQLGVSPGFDPPPGLTHPAQKSLASCLTAFIDDENERALAFDLLSRALFEKATESLAHATVVPWLLGQEEIAGKKANKYEVSPATSDCHSTAASDSEEASPPVSVEQPKGSTAEVPSPFRLRSAARPWLPQSAAQPRHTVQQWPAWSYAQNGDLTCNPYVGYLAETAAWTIEQAAKGAHVHRLRERRGWSVIARVSESDLWRCGELIAAARHQVMRQTNMLPGMVILRSREKKQGFCVSFGFVDDVSKACWDMVQTGQCCRRHACRWEHPKNTRRLFVAVKLASSEHAAEGEGEESEGEEEATV
mmetsp:Transcript_65334/g.174105  ORF Transcript_65334/g.174105 Transcript_65334/m.174105 type:complete len:314 (-) Transcript_65334:137-1078(-)|eukprot:CAMPEP_0171183540 /NCGR_PEP_ID=MMETSP0790-20130122/15330_1 /TAXON_ID=2925 /ORGANISM="Alexandrium catenella, Strain OF101" /LENGTH=313 /DNA_ID=CAMNT_0011648517 /DNA_START=90 /DNA_END=1031 /DNA_ORIENTATION=+